MSDVKTSADAYRLIHSALAQWIATALECGFEGSPVDLKTEQHDCDELMLMARRMREIEGHTDIEGADE